jgi:hypothetical protein
LNAGATGITSVYAADSSFSVWVERAIEATKDQRLGRLTESWRSTGIERDPQKLF